MQLPGRTFHFSRIPHFRPWRSRRNKAIESGQSEHAGLIGCSRGPQHRLRPGTHAQGATLERTEQERNRVADSRRRLRKRLTRARNREKASGRRGHPCPAGKPSPRSGNAAPDRRKAVLLDLAFLVLDMLARDRVVFPSGHLLRHRARVLPGHVEMSRACGRVEADLDRRRLRHGSSPSRARSAH